MAIPTYIGSGTKTANTGTNVPAAPSSWQADDILLLTVQYDEAPGLSLTSAEGFAEVTNSPVGTPTTASSLSVFWKRATSGSDTMPTIGDPGDHTGAQMHVFRGCITTGNPWDVTDNGNAGNAASYATDGVTTTVADCLIVEIICDGFDTATAQSSGEANANLANLAERADSWMSTAGGGGFVVLTGEKASAGATGSTTGNLATSAQKCWLTIALKPPGGASPQNVSPDAIALTLTPVAPVPVQTNLSPDALPLTATAVAPVMLQAQLVTPDPLTLTLTPVAPVPVQTNVTVGAVSLTLTPVAPTVTQAGAAQQVTPDALALTLTVATPTVTAGSVLVTPAPIALTLTPVAPTVTFVSGLAAFPDALALTLTPQAPVIPSANIRLIPALALTLTPVAPFDIEGGAIVFRNIGTSAAPDFVDNDNLSTYMTTTWTPPSGGGGLIVAFVLSRNLAGTDPATPTMSGNSITWDGVATEGRSLTRVTMFLASSEGANAGVTTIDFGGETQTAMIVQFCYVHQTETTNQVVTLSSTGGTTASVTLAAAADTDNRMIAGIGHNNVNNVTPRTDWVELDELSTSSAVRSLQTQYRPDAAETTASGTWTSGSPWVIIAAEFIHREGGNSVSPAPVALTLTPVAPSLAVTPVAVSLTVTPVAPSVGIAAAVGPAAISLTLTAVEPLVNRLGASQNVSPAALNLGLVVYAPVLGRIAPPPFSLTITPSAPVLGQMAPPAISLTLTPVAPHIYNGPLLRPLVLTLTLVPVDPSVQVGVAQSVSPAAVGLTLTPVTPSLTRPLVVDVIPLTVTPVAPSVNRGVNVGAIGLTLTPVAPVVTELHLIRPEPVALTVTPRTPMVVNALGGLADATDTVRIGATWFNPADIAGTKQAGRVHDVMYAGGYYYVATEGADRAQTLAGVTHTCHSLIRIDATTWDLDTSWFPTFDQAVTQIQLHSTTTDGTTIWVAGSFNSMTLGGITYNRSKIIAINATTGVPTSWTPPVFNSTVRAIVYDAGHIYCAGEFTGASGNSRNRSASVNSSTGALESWHPNFGIRTNDIRLFTETGGAKRLVFAMNGNGAVGGSGTHNVAVIGAIGEADAGTLVWGAAEGSGGGHVCAVSNSKQRIFYGTKGSGGNVVWCYNASGTKQWSSQSINTNGDIQALTAYKGGESEDKLYVGTHDTSFSSTPGGSASANVGSGFARFDIDTGNFDPTFFPEFRQDGSATDPYDGHTLKLWRIRGFEGRFVLAVGGDFTQVETVEGNVSPAPRRITFFQEQGTAPPAAEVSPQPIALTVGLGQGGWNDPWDGPWDAGLLINQGVGTTPGAEIPPLALTLTAQAPIVTALRTAPEPISLTVTSAEPTVFIPQMVEMDSFPLFIVPISPSNIVEVGPEPEPPPEEGVPVFVGTPIPGKRRVLFTRPR